MKYYRPETVEDYFKLRSKLIEKHVVLLAGGTDLMPRYEGGQALPDHLIDLKQLSQLSSIIVSDDHVEIGALTTIQNLHDHAIIQDEYRALHQAAHEFAGAQIRHRASLGGNICNASPAGDLLPGLYAFDASIEITGPDETRRVAIGNFILGPGKTDLRADELLTAIILPRKHLDSTFIKVGLRQSMAISVVNLALVYSRLKISFTRLKIAAGSVAPTVVTLDDFTTAYLADPHQLTEHISLIEGDISPIDDIRATASYRRRVLKNLVKDFIINQ